MIIYRLATLLFVSLFLSLNVMGQQDSSALDWSDQFNRELDRVKSLQQQGQNRSAFQLSEEILLRAVADQNIPGIIGALPSLIRNIYRVEDDAYRSVLVKVARLEPDHPVVQAVVNTYHAELLTGYYERNRHLISQHTEQANLSWEDIHRWSAGQIEKTIDSLYHSSVQPAMLADIPAVKTASLMNNGKQEVAWEYRPRLYDLMQDRLISFLQNNRFHWEPQTEAVDPTMADLLTRVDLSDYLKTTTSETKHQAIFQAFDQWEKSLLAADEISAYLDVFVRRLQYVNNYIGQKYWSKSIAVLEAAMDQYSETSNRLILDYEKANLQFRMGDNQTALETLESALKQLPDDPPQAQIDRINSLIYTIKTPEISVQTEDLYPSGLTPLISIQFRNINRVRLEVFPISEDELVEWRFNRRPGEDANLFLHKKAVWQELINLPKKGDYKSHRTEILIDGKLDKGAYALRYYYHKDNVKISGVAVFQVSNLGLISSTGKESGKLFVVDGRTGEKVEGAKVEAISMNRDGRGYNKEIRLIPEFAPGSFLPPDKMYNLYYKVSHGDDRYISPLTYHNTGHWNEFQPFQRTMLLTDRSIYQPGQTIHFKALTTLTQKLESELVKNKTVELSLRNANGKMVWQKTYKTDQWGTVTGTIPIPVSGLKGSWSLSASPSGHTAIQVEAYQRPNFEVVIPDSSISREEDQIALTGHAKTYHGFPIQSGPGTVNVQLQRRHWFFSREPESSDLIYSGTFETDENGTFQVNFAGVDPPETNYRYGALYFYSIHATVQAASGEIREITKEIPLDPDQQIVQIDVQDFQLWSEIKPVRFTVKNALQQPQSQDVKIQISRLLAPKKYKVDRYWDLPDLPLINAREFDKEIKNLFYDHQASMNEWGEESSVRSWSSTIEDSDSLDLQEIIDEAGYYRMLIVSPEGDTLATKSFGIGSADEDNIVHDAIEITTNIQAAQPGQTAHIRFHKPKESKGGQIQVAYPDGTIQNYDLARTKSLDIDVNEKDRGGIHVRVFGMLANRFYTKSMTIEVPWSNKELKISGLSDMTSLEVDSDTSVTIEVKDQQANGAFAEVAAVIYDASLDAYVMHDWLSNQSFFRGFSDPTSVRNLTGRIGDLITSQNNYWNDRPDVEMRYVPVLPNLNFGYGHYPFDQRVMMSMNKSEDSQAYDRIELAVEESMPPPRVASDDGGQPTKPEQIRKDFEETILFLGKETTDSTGRLTIPFRTNDKAGRWKMMIFAHTPDLKTGLASYVFETSQDILLESYLPGMVRQGDEMKLTYTIFNNTDQSISGNVRFQVSSLFQNKDQTVKQKSIDFELDGKASTLITVPFFVNRDERGPMILTTRVSDHNGKILDATEEVLPVFPSMELVHDGNVYVLEEGQSLDGSEAVNMSENGQGQVTIRIVNNMYSELLKSIPYLQVSNPVTTDQYFRNGIQAMLGQYIAGQIPDFETIYAEWKRKGELESRLAQNEDKKYVALDNTPWVRQSDSGTEQMALLGLYFDERHIEQVIESNLSNWVQSQNPDGGFPWIKDGPSSFFITVRFLDQWKNVIGSGLAGNYFTEDMQLAARKYIDTEFVRMWKDMKERTADSTISYHRFIPYFTLRAYEFSSEETPEGYMGIWNELRDSVYANWSDHTDLLRAEIGIAAHHLADKTLSQTIVKGFLDNAVQNSELGTYWRYNHQTAQNGYLGVLSRITELLVLNDETSLNNGILQWVLVNKMTNDWHQNPNVTALMLSLLKMSGDWTTPSQSMITYGDNKIQLSGIGDVSDISLSADELNTLQIDHISGPPIWVGMSSSRMVEPEEEFAQSGDVLHIEKIVTGLPSSDSIHLGDQMTIQLRISSDRDLDYVYIQDPIVPGLDPGISLSGFKWKYGLSYYQTFDAASAEFFIQHLPKGEYLLEYNLGVVRSGKFRHPYSKIQSYFVPEINGVDQWRPLVEISER